MNKQETYLRSIRHTYPDLRITTVEFNDRGQNNDVLVINTEFIFRFPKYAHVLEGLKLETAILNGVREYITLDIPLPMFLNLEDRAVGQAFVGYRSIPGEPLWRETFRLIGDERTRDRLAEQLANFLNELHNVPAEEAITYKLPVSDTHEEWSDIYARIQEKLVHHMKPDARQWATGHFETFLSETSNFVYQPVLKHSDFGPSNILFDRQAQAIQGIIDFGGSCLGDPAYDFAGLLSGYGESFVMRCSKTYPQLESFMERVRFYQGTFALLEALFGVENNDEDAFNDGIEMYV